jgi:hypothetical protein
LAASFFTNPTVALHTQSAELVRWVASVVDPVRKAEQEEQALLAYEPWYSPIPHSLHFGSVL